MQLINLILAGSILCAPIPDPMLKALQAMKLVSGAEFSEIIAAEKASKAAAELAARGKSPLARKAMSYETILRLNPHLAEKANENPFARKAMTLAEILEANPKLHSA